MARNLENFNLNPLVSDDALGCDMQSTSSLDLAGLPVMDEIGCNRLAVGSRKFSHQTSTSLVDADALKTPADL